MTAKIVKRLISLCVLGLSVLLVAFSATAATVGEVAPDFEVMSQHGEAIRLSDFRGKKAVYVVFWNTWCSYCIKKVPRLTKLHEQFGDKIEIVAINTMWSDSLEKMQSFEKRYHINYSMAFDTGELITDQYQVISVPTEFIIDVNGIIRYRNRVPEYPVAHLPDWSQPKLPSETAAVAAPTL